MNEPERWSGRAWVAAIGVTVAAGAAWLWQIGQPVWCRCGSFVPWSWDVDSRHCSQHLVDPYSFTHVLHGLVFYAMTRVTLGRRLSVGWRAAIVVVLETAWELLENSPVIIERYRAATISLDYFGDSVINSLSDVGCCLFGFWIASRISWKGSVSLFVAVELVLLFWIRDNLTLNVVMLVHPIDAIKVWQSAVH